MWGLGRSVFAGSSFNYEDGHYLHIALQHWQRQDQKVPRKKHQRAPKKVPKSFNYMGSRSVGHQSTQKVLKYINFTLQLHTGTGKTKKYPEEGPKSTLKSTKEHLKKYQKALILRVASWSVIRVPYEASKYVTFTLQLHPGEGKSTLQPQHLLQKKVIR